ncbi:hypothetical protein EDD18DRAFT_1107280 [Armillaria luteobubalina]|uniref:Uncharacterized protein n=1 Tax=Armillaria luteobubalina TaxID=153913 RepID=A0AA39Q102_9AGAR|nr:hypothetical protein EDD18DRAFT_1107280 [Armillaria luteobubalina]
MDQSHASYHSCLSNGSASPVNEVIGEEGNEIGYSPIGLWNMTRKLEFGVPLAHSLTLQQSSLMSIAFFAAGTHGDTNHRPSQAESQPDFLKFPTQALNAAEYGHHQSTHIEGLLDLVCICLRKFKYPAETSNEQATLLDRAFGGTTLVVHYAGTFSQANVPERPQPTVYLSPKHLGLETEITPLIKALTEKVDAATKLKAQPVDTLWPLKASVASPSDLSSNTFKDMSAKSRAVPDASQSHPLRRENTLTLPLSAASSFSDLGINELSATELKVLNYIDDMEALKTEVKRLQEEIAFIHQRHSVELGHFYHRFQGELASLERVSQNQHGLLAYLEDWVAAGSQSDTFSPPGFTACKRPFPIDNELGSGSLKKTRLCGTTEAVSKEKDIARDDVGNT